jgi:AmmeMemoRadiSam system protein B
MTEGLFCLTDKDFETPLGIVKSEKRIVDELREAGGETISKDDFPHLSEHSIEFQVLFLRHLMRDRPFTIIPILCGSLVSGLPQYGRAAYLEKADPFLGVLRRYLADADDRIFMVAGIDLSHIGPKFGHQTTAAHLKNRASEHDKALLGSLSNLEPDPLWKESADVGDRYNVCGFSAMACLVEVLPPCQGRILGYEFWEEAATQSAVSFAAGVFTRSTPSHTVPPEPHGSPPSGK